MKWAETHSCKNCKWSKYDGVWQIRNYESKVIYEYDKYTCILKQLEMHSLNYVCHNWTEDYE